MRSRHRELLSLPVHSDVGLTWVFERSLQLASVVFRAQLAAATRPGGFPTKDHIAGRRDEARA